MSSFNPFEQNITMIAGDGTTMVIPLPDIDHYVYEGMSTCINYGSQLGASIVTFVLLFLLTRAKKRRSTVFCLNVTALLLNVVRLVCQVLFYTGAWFESYAYFSGDVSRVKTGDYANSIMGGVMTALVEILIESSLIVQTMVVCTNVPVVQKTVILILSILVATITIGFRMGQMVLNSILIVGNRPSTPYVWLQKVDTILITISICFFCVILCSKLGYTIRRRQQLGVRQFGPMQVIFIMSCQTMILPALFSILQFTKLDLHEINANILTFVVVSLPVTTIWASTALPGQSRAQEAEAGLPLWDKLSSNNSTRLEGMPSRQFRQYSGSTNATTAVDPVDLLYQDTEIGKPAAIRTQQTTSFN